MGAPARLGDAEERPRAREGRGMERVWATQTPSTATRASTCNAAGGRGDTLNLAPSFVSPYDKIYCFATATDEDGHQLHNVDFL